MTFLQKTIKQFILIELRLDVFISRNTHKQKITSKILNCKFRLLLLATSSQADQ